MAGPGSMPRAVVGIGASAGGIETQGRLLGAMPADTGCAFVVILHLDPTRNSQLAPLLGNHTKMPVVEIVDGMPLEANRVHVIVPNRTLTLSGGKLRLIEPVEPRGRRHPVDAFFVSLAAECGERAIGIVLSGTGSNGTHGLREIKTQGGMTLVQDPATAKFAGMPSNAIAAGVADHVLVPEKMPEVLLRYLAHGYASNPDHKEARDEEPGQPGLDPVLGLLRLRSNQDFRDYKRGTLLRRINRRMGLANIATVAGYTEHLRKHPEETDALVKDLMISVTGFFRDPEAWQALDEMVITPLVAARKDDAELRFWVPACATGEEAYSLAMLTAERAEAAGKQFQMKIFATDRVESNLQRAREGVYPEAAAASIPAARLARFFDNLDGSHQIKNKLREQIVFAPQNLLHDPPFSRLDLITCRNLLIYLEPEAQQRVIALFHFALREGGHLFLGNAESVGRHEELFDTVSKKWRIYRRVGPTRHDIVHFPTSGARQNKPITAPADANTQPAPRAAELARRLLLERYAPAAVLIDDKYRVLYFHGPVGDFLELPAGEPTRDLLAMVREALRVRLRGALLQARDNNESVTFTANWPRNGADRPVSVTVAPAAAAGQDPGAMLVSFETPPQPPRAGVPAAPAPRHEGDPSEMRVLEQELKSTRETLQAAIEQLEGANEELQAANEEATSMNEELQSTNEELETSKEELQSFNEELHTANSQLQHKVQEVEKANDDLNNLLAGTEIATLFLDSDCRITWFSPACRNLLDLVASDIGRPLGHFAKKFTDPNLLRDVEAVLARLTRIEAEVPGHDGRWYLRRLIPYRTQDNRIRGAVLTFADITERRQAEELRARLAAIVEFSNDAVISKDLAGVITSWNKGAQRLFGYSAEEAIGQSVSMLIPPDRRDEESRILERIRLGEPMEHFDTVRRRKDGRLIDVSVTVSPIKDGAGKVVGASKIARDISERKKLEEHRDLLAREAAHRVKNCLATVGSIARQTLREDNALNGFLAAFEGRLDALARSHDLLVSENWNDIELAVLIRLALEPFMSSQQRRLTMDGPALSLPAQSAVALMLILHELGTNAVKYGALSRSEGRLAVTWRLEDGPGGARVRLSWLEAGGPRVGPSSLRGFGTTLIERSAAHELDGKAMLDFREAGLHCELNFPVSPARQAA